jgi:formate dehydrogenase gamma subunit
MFPFERIEHLLLASSFIVLAWTGLALKYPDAFWARPLLFGEAIGLRRNIHRVAAVIMTIVSFMHLFSLILSKRLREHWLHMLPKASDAKDAMLNTAYNLGFTDNRPKMPSHSYIEKAEYWALVWGTIVMWMTGVLLWGDTFVLKWLPKIVLDVATSIHFYEAVLATLAIIIWHFYFVIFDPDVYPMDSAWLTGRSPRKETGSHQPE